MTVYEMSLHVLNACGDESQDGGKLVFNTKKKTKKKGDGEKKKSSAKALSNQKLLRFGDDE